MLKFTIGTVSSNMQFDETMQLIKSSLLYADEIELIGILEYAIFSYLPHAVNDAKDLDYLLNSITPFLRQIDDPSNKALLNSINEISSQLKYLEPILRKKKHRSKEEILAQQQLKTIYSTGKKEISEQVEQFLWKPETCEIKTLIERNIVSVYDYDYDYKSFAVEHLTGSYFVNLLNTIRNNSAFPLFDKMSVDGIKLVANTNLLDFGNINPEIIRHAGIATNILMTLPTLQSASIDEIISFRQDNEKSLVGFRKAIFEFSEKIDSMPWDDDFPFECLKLYSTEVAPKIEELNILSSETSTIRNFGRKIVADAEARQAAGFLVGGIVATVLRQNGLMEALAALRDTLLGLSLLYVAPKFGTGFLKTLDIHNQAKKVTDDNINKMQGNTMYYYYKASQKL